MPSQKNHVVGQNNHTGLLSVFSKKPVRNEVVVRVPSTEVQQHNGVTWIDVQDPEADSLNEFGERYNLQPIHFNKSLKVSHIARMEVESDYIFLLLHFPYHEADTNKISSHQVMIFLGKDYLLTVHAAETETIRKLFTEYQSKNTTETKSPARILYHLIEKELEDFDKIIQGTFIQLDRLEEKVFDVQNSDAQQISQLRHKIMRLRRSLTAQKDILKGLDTVIDKFADEHLRRYFTANANRSVKLWESIEEARETIEIYKDADFTSSQERTNEILGILTIIFTLSIPATVIGTFYGMNIPLPGIIGSESWTFFGKYTTLILILSACLTPIIAMYVYFKKKHWF